LTEILWILRPALGLGCPAPDFRKKEIPNIRSFGHTRSAKMSLNEILPFIRSYWLSASVLVQIILIVHVIKTGRPYWWIWLIFFFPLVGAAVYVLVEVVPDVGRLSVPDLLWKFKSPGQKIALLQEVIEESDTFNNRTDLAAEYFRQKKYEQAAATWKDCLRGPHQDDVYALLDLAECYFVMSQYASIRPLLDRMDLSQAINLENRKMLIEARTCEALGPKDRASELYRFLIDGYPGEEPRYRYAMLLIQEDNRKEARELLQGILKKYRQAGPRWRKDQRTWYRLAKKGLKTLA
jgi:hypothetical protein